MITKNHYDPNEYEWIELIYETVIVSSSFKNDLTVLIKTFKEGELIEYEEMIQKAFRRLEDKVRLILTAREIDGAFNATFHVETLFSGALLVCFSGDGCRKR